MSSFDLWDASTFKSTQSFHICIANAVYHDVCSYRDINCDIEIFYIVATLLTPNVRVPQC